MKIKNIKRVIKSKTTNKVRTCSKKISPISITAMLFIFSLVVSCMVNLVVGSVLTPRGKELQSLNTEKEILLEDNRILEQEIAEFSSLSVVTARAEKDLNMKKVDDVMYVNSVEATASLMVE